MNPSVIKTLTGSDSKCKLMNESELKSKNPSSYTATISGVKQVNSLFPGTVLFLGFYKGMGTITIAVSNHEVVRYCNLTDINVWNYTSVVAGQKIGEAYPNSSFQFEYCTQWKGTSKFPVRVDNKLYFKQNPIDILNGTYIPQNEITIKNGIVRPRNKVTFTAAQMAELGPTSIDNSDTYVEGAQIVEGS